MAFEKIIVLDDEMIIRKSLETHLRRKHYSVATASKIAEAEALLGKDQFDLIFVDMRLPDGEGTELLERLSEMPDAPLVVVITGYGTIEGAVDCMRKGAFDYIVKPCAMDEIDVILKKAESYSQLVKVNRYFSNEQTTTTEIIGGSPAMRRLRTMIKKVAATEATVLVTGENGTGKELVAGELYRQSPRAGQPFIKVNCAAISETLIESEFFGHEKGAFTGANQRREGRFELANNGTILLDEIGEIPPRLQAKLLRVLQEREFERVGGNRTIRADVRVLATTNRNLLKEVEKGNFREDLYYRLNVFPIEVPPLRERGEDIALIAQAFLERFSRKHGLKQMPGFSKSTMELILRHPWPGNVRELQNTVERAVIMCDPDKAIQPYMLGLIKANMIGAPDMDDEDEELFSPIAVPVTAAANASAAPANGAVEPRTAAPTSDHDGKVKTLEELEKEHILSVLRQMGWKRAEASDVLGISSRTLRNKITQYREEGVDIP